MISLQYPFPTKILQPGHCRGPGGEAQDGVEAPGRGPGQETPSQEGDLHGGTAGGKAAPQGRNSRSWGLAVSLRPGTRQSAGAGPLVQEPRGPTSSQDPDLVIPRGPQAGEGPCWCPVDTRASSRNCQAQHHRTPPEKPLVCDRCGGQLMCRCCPRTQLCQVHTEDGSQEQCTGTQAFPKTLQVTLFQQKPLKELPQACRCREGLTRAAPPAAQETLRMAKGPLLCARCAERLGSDRQPQTAESPLVCPQCGQASGPGCGAPDPQAQRLYVRAQRGKAFARCSGLHRHRKTHSAEQHRHSRALARRSCLLGCPPCGDCGEGTRGPPREPVAGQKPYERAECAKAFALLSHLAEHRRARTGEKPYGRPGCGKAFRGCPELRQHARLHSGEKPSVCRDCGKAFVRTRSLVRHRRPHAGRAAS